MRRGKAFTLIELVVVIAIIAILVAIVSPTAFRAIERARNSTTANDLKSIKTAAMSYNGDCSAWPATGSGPTYFMNNTGAVATWDGPYLDRWPVARWSGGVYTFLNDSAVDWTGVAPGDSARYVQLTSVPAANSAAIDLIVDGTAGATSGFFRINGTTVYYLIDTAVVVN